MNPWNFKEDRNLRSFLKMREITEALWHNPTRIVNKEYWPKHRFNYPILEVLDRISNLSCPLYQVRVLQHPNASLVSHHTYSGVYIVTMENIYSLMTSSYPDIIQNGKIVAPFLPPESL